MAGIVDPEKQEWDVIVVGTGIGGATLGYALAKAGKRVLFCEKGRSHLSDKQALRGDYAESFFDRPEVPQAKHRDILARAGRCTDEMEDQSSNRMRRHIPFIGEGTGGSSALYGMAMERFFPADFQPRRNFPQATNTNLPERWPISYEELLPYYEAAEQLYRVRRSLDLRQTPEVSATLEPAPLLSPGNQELYNFFQNKGLHPYQLPLACEYVPGCQGCQSYLCPQACKNDSSRVCLEPALVQYGAQLLDQCSVLHLEADSDRVSGVVCSWQGKKLTLRSELVVLAAGALQTPVLLLRSACQEWPDGLANDSGLVGRNLMRHCIDLYAVFTKNRELYRGNVKEIAFNDLYHDDQKLGSVQSFGTLPPPPIIVEQMQQDLRDGPWPPAAVLFGPIKPLLRPLFSRLFSRSTILASIMEDLPYPENRILPAEEQNHIILKYRLYPHEQDRIKLFRQQMRDILKPYRFMLLKQAENNDRIAHVCGTCRFGVNNGGSVLNPVNRAHSVSNLYVVDSSFFPSSAGINPSLTIAANALRVADHIVGRINVRDLLEPIR